MRVHYCLICETSKIDYTCSYIPSISACDVRQFCLLSKDYNTHVPFSQGVFGKAENFVAMKS